MKNLDSSVYKQTVYPIKPFLDLSCCSSQFISTALMAPLPKERLIAEAKQLLLRRHR